MKQATTVTMSEDIRTQKNTPAHLINYKIMINENFKLILNLVHLIP